MMSISDTTFYIIVLVVAVVALSMNLFTIALLGIDRELFAWLVIDLALIAVFARKLDKVT